MQAQEYEPAKWALGLRLRHATVDADIERAFDDGRILRTHVMRPTWHFVAPADIRWLLELTAPRVHRAMSSYNRRLELDARTFARGTSIIERALGGGQYLTRTELGERLGRAGLPMATERLAHMMLHAELEAVVCSGPRRDRKFTYALLSERAPRAPRLPRDEALAALSQRFVRSHGPATVRDFVWWSGLTTSDAKRAMDMLKARREEVGGRTYWTIGQPPRGADRDIQVWLLPIYDEYLVAYRDREAVPHGPSTIASAMRGAVMFQHALVIAGQVAGTWRTSRDKQGVNVHVVPLRRLSARDRTGIASAVHRFEQFVAVPVQFSIG
jgi:hypothetical protein